MTLGRRSHFFFFFQLLFVEQKGRKAKGPRSRGPCWAYLSRRGVRHALVVGIRPSVRPRRRGGHPPGQLHEVGRAPASEVRRGGRGRSGHGGLRPHGLPAQHPPLRETKRPSQGWPARSAHRRPAGATKKQSCLLAGSPGLLARPSLVGEIVRLWDCPRWQGDRENAKRLAQTSKPLC